ncbi:MAG: PRC-barrel domain-containing protein [Acetobacteraceae bacterium]|nr:PRC-barrel domain-containing protein [Acetobacteraceae bacterium]
MFKGHSAGIAAALRIVLGWPALPQTPPSSASSAPGGTSPAATSAIVPSGSAQKSQNDWRGRTLIGTPVFNDTGQRMATINDLLITDDGKVDRVILLLRRERGKLVAVPFNELHFLPSTRNALTGMPATGIALPPPGGYQLKTYGAVLPGASRDSLAQMEPFRFAP